MYRKKFMDIAARAQVATLALESDMSHMETPMQADPLIDASIDPMFISDDSDSIATKVLATNEAAKGLDIVLEDIEDAIVVSQEIREISEIVKAASPESITPATVELMNFIVESACQRIGFYAKPLPALENFTIDPNQHISVTLESFKGRLASILEAVINGIKKAVAAAKQWYHNLFDTSRAIQAQSQKLLTMAKSITTTTASSTYLESSHFAAQLAIGNSLPSNMVQEAQKFDQFLTAFLGSITRVTNDGYQELLSALNDTTSDNRNYVKALMRVMEAIDTNGGNFRFPNGIDEEGTHRSATLLGNRVFVIKTTKAPSEDPQALIQSLQYAGFEVQRQAANVDSVPTLSAADIAKISQIANGMSANIAKYKGLTDQLEKSKMAMASAVANIRTRFANEEDQSWNWVASFVESSLIFSNKMFDAPPRLVLNNASEVARSLLSYADKSIRQYEVKQPVPAGHTAEEAVAA